MQHKIESTRRATARSLTLTLSLSFCLGVALSASVALPQAHAQAQAQQPDNLRFRMPLGDDGVYSFTTVRPAPYTVPYDGPVGTLLRAGGRHAWRPAHFHFRVLAEGHAPLTTELFPADDPYIDQDAVFGVRASLAVPFVRCEAPGDAARYGLPIPFSLVTFDFRMSPAR